MKNFFLNVWRYGRWVLLTIVVLFIALVIYRIPFVAEQERTQETITYIRAQKLTMEDVTGERLPPTPDSSLVDATVEGIDVNKNGIRDDVELAIFKKYSNNIKVRAALLQYAESQQLYLTKVFNSGTLIAVAQEDEQASACLADQLSRDDIQNYFQNLKQKKEEIKNMILNTEARHERANANTFLVQSFGSLDGNNCDVDPEILFN